MIPVVRRLTAESSPDEVAAAAELLREYRAFVAAGAGPGFRMPRLDAEIAGLPSAFCDPGSALLLAHLDGRPAGCLALRSLVDEAELKRMWARPAARGRGVGEALVTAAVAIAAADGRRGVRLDTEPDRMAAAIRLYRRMGFVAVPPPADADPGLAFFRLDLDQRG